LAARVSSIYGAFVDLPTRLDTVENTVATQLAETMKQIDIENALALKRSNALKLNAELDFDDETKAQITGVSPITYSPIIADNSVTNKKIIDSYAVGKNLFDKYDVELGKYISSSTGEIIIGESGTGINALTGYIEIPASGEYYHSHYAGVVAYDENKTYIAGYAGGTARVRDLIAGAKYVRISMVSSDIDVFQFEQGAVATEYEDFKYSIKGLKPFDLYSEFGSLQPSKINGYILGKNIFNKNSATLNAYVTTSGGGIIQGASGTGLNYYSDFILVEELTTYYRNEQSSVIFYTINKDFISAIYDEPSGTSGAFITPANTAYIIVSGQQADIASLQVELGDIGTVYEDYGFKITGLISDYDNSSLANNFIFGDILGSVTEDDKNIITVDTITGQRTYTMISTDENATKIEYIFKVSEGSCIQVDLTAKATQILSRRASVKIWYTPIIGIEDEGMTYDITSVDEYKDFIYRFPIPQGIISAKVVLYVRNNEMSIRNYEIYKISKPKAPINEGVKFIAHLGMPEYAPRNTMPAFTLASNAGFYGCVINTGMTSDGYIVALHDDTIDATSNGSGDISTMTLAEVKTYDFGSWFKPIYTGTKIPLLEDVLKLCARSGMHPYIRLSSRFLDNSDGVFTQMYNMAKRNGLLGNISFKAFTYAGLNSANALFGDKARYGYSSSRTTTDVDLMAVFPNAYIDVYYSDVTQPLVDYALANGVEVEAWTVNEFMTAYNLMNMGVTRFTTDTISLDGCIY